MAVAGWRAHVRGHFLLFDGRAAPGLTAKTAARLLVIAALLEILRMAAVNYLHPPLWLLLPLLAALTFLAIVTVPGVAASPLGLVRWRDWTLTEKSYLVQVVILASLVFPLVLGPGLARRFSSDGPAMVRSVFLPYACYGFYQELVYRGMVQSALSRRGNVAAGIGVANLLYTFGPLHWQYFHSPASTAVPMFAGIFAIGMFFGGLYWRSGNLWLPAIFHAIGNAFIVSSMA